MNKLVGVSLATGLAVLSIALLWPRDSPPAKSPEPTDSAEVKYSEADFIAAVDGLTGEQLVEALSANKILGADLDTAINGGHTGPIKGGVLTYRCLRRIGQLKYAPGIPILVKHIDSYFYTDPTGTRFSLRPRAIVRSLPPGQDWQVEDHRIPPILLGFGEQAVPEVTAAYLMAEDQKRHVLLMHVLIGSPAPALQHARKLLKANPEEKTAKKLHGLIQELESRHPKLKQARVP
jgi:hypothetical protein